MIDLSILDASPRLDDERETISPRIILIILITEILAYPMLSETIIARKRRKIRKTIFRFPLMIVLE